MGDFIPAGRLSAVDHGDQKIAIQTEFSKYPEPRVATSVSIGGRTIHKIQKLWGKAIESLDEMRQVEELINRQHDEVTALVHEHAPTLIRHSEKEHSERTVRNTLEQAELVPAVEAVFLILPDGKIETRSRVTKEAELLAEMIRSLADVLFDMAQVSNLGDCEDCVLNLGNRDALFLPFQGGYLVALTDSKARKREILAELWKIARAA